LGIILAVIFKGSLAQFGKLKLKAWPLVFVALLLQVVLFQGYFPLNKSIIIFLYPFSLFFLLFFVYMNRRIPGMKAIMVGLLLNLLVISINGGLMPANYDAYLKAGMEQSAKRLAEYGWLNNVRIMNESTHLKFLGDWILLPIPFSSTSTVVSIGDLILLFGLFYLTWRVPLSQLSFF